MFLFVFCCNGCCRFTCWSETHYLTGIVLIPLAMLINLVDLTYCKVCYRLQGNQDTDLASLMTI